MTSTQDPREAVTALADSAAPYLLGVRHHSPALAAAVPALLDASGAEVVCVELPADFQHWLPHLAAPGTLAPVALAGASEGGRLGFYPFADFSPELAALRWARERGVKVVCCDLPMSDPAWSADGFGVRAGESAPDPQGPAPGTDGSAADTGGPASDTGGARSAAAGPSPAAATRSADTRDADMRDADMRSAVAEAAPLASPTAFAAALTAAGTGRDGDDLWDRCVEVLAPGCAPEAIRRAALGVGWALRRDAESAGGVPSVDLARETHMRDTIARAAADGRRVAAVIGAFHAPALTAASATGPAEAERETRTQGTTGAGVTAASRGAALVGDHPCVVTSLVPYAFDLLDSRSGYPAGIRDPRWQQAVFTAAGDPGRLRDAAARAIT
ncbi:DUF5682 family protein, partial [Streptomyces bottropensis]|uniref:DUF5682 family protein n=1 Tax=Streptomyces bottropensis TaxID=42235 RepID=UPI00367EEF17